MSACKTGCGRSAHAACLCAVCSAMWASSAELKRSAAIAREATGTMKGERYGVALVDFCNRVRAERRPEVT